MKPGKKVVNYNDDGSVMSIWYEWGYHYSGAYKKVIKVLRNMLIKSGIYLVPDVFINYAYYEEDEQQNA